MTNCKLYFIAILLLLMPVCRSFAQTADPGLPGTHAVVKIRYDLGSLAYTPPAAAMFPANMEVTGSVHYPADLSSGPFPVIVILHGRHFTSYDSVTLDAESEWPCTGRSKPITSYEGYDYLAKTMASHGYIVISISANAINAIDGGLSDAGMNARGVLVQHHLDLWNQWNTTGGFPGDSALFLGRLDMQNIGTMGHSRGGEGMVYNAEYNRSLGSPYGIKAVMTLAPVDFYRHVLNGIPLMDVSPYCDGDVNDLEGVHFYDDARYNDTADQSGKHHVLFMGANHDFFNTVWTPGSYIAGGFDDWLYEYSYTSAWCGPNATPTARFDTTTQKAALNAYFSAFFRVYLGHEQQFAPLINADIRTPPVSSRLDSSQVYVSFHPARENRLDLNRTDSIDRIAVNTLGDSVIISSLYHTQICGGGFAMTDCAVAFTGPQLPHDGDYGDPGVAAMGMQWVDTTGYYENVIPVASQDLTAYHDLIFRTAVNFSESAPVAYNDFTIRLTDSAGHTSSQTLSSQSNALFYQPGTEYDDLPKLMFNTVKMPLNSFANVDRSKIRKVKFLFNRSTSGSIFISDIAFSSSPCGGITAAFTDTATASWKSIAFTNTSASNTADSVSWFWSFGDAGSGTANTSTLRTPAVHNYTTVGTYDVCLAVTANRKNGYICTDTFCKTITVAYPADVSVVSVPAITIAPNPATDHLHITGAATTDLLVITDLYGRVILSQTLNNATVPLPPYLVPGIYYATINTMYGNVYKKIIIK